MENDMALESENGAAAVARAHAADRAMWEECLAKEKQRNAKHSTDGMQALEASQNHARNLQHERDQASMALVRLRKDLTGTQGELEKDHAAEGVRDALIKDLTSESNMLRMQVNNLQEELAQMTARATTAEDDRRALEKLAAGLTEDLDEASGLGYAAEQQAVSLRARILECGERDQQQQTKLAQAHMEAMKFEHDIEEMRADARATCESLQGALDKERAGHSVILNDCERVQCELRCANLNVDTLRVEKDAAENAVQDVTRQRDEGRVALRAQEASINDLNGTVSALDRRLQRSSIEVDVAKEEQTQASNALRDADDRIKELSAVKKAVGDALDASTEGKAALKARIRTLVTEQEQREASMNDALDSLRKYQQREADVEASARVEHERFCKGEADNEILTLKHKSLALRLDGMEREKGLLQAKIEEGVEQHSLFELNRTVDYAKWSDTMSEMKARHDEHSRKIRHLADELTASQEALVSSQRESAAREAGLREGYQAREQDVSDTHAAALLEVHGLILTLILTPALTLTLTRSP